jgi:hypothetical protein
MKSYVEIYSGLYSVIGIIEIVLGLLASGLCTIDLHSAEENSKSRFASSHRPDVQNARYSKRQKLSSMDSTQTFQQLLTGEQCEVH